MSISASNCTLRVECLDGDNTDYYVMYGCFSAKDELPSRITFEDVSVVHDRELQKKIMVWNRQDDKPNPSTALAQWLNSANKEENTRLKGLVQEVSTKLKATKVLWDQGEENKEHEPAEAVLNRWLMQTEEADFPRLSETKWRESYSRAIDHAVEVFELQKLSVTLCSDQTSGTADKPYNELAPFRDKMIPSAQIKLSLIDSTKFDKATIKEKTEMMKDAFKKGEFVWPEAVALACYERLRQSCLHQPRLEQRIERIKPLIKSFDISKSSEELKSDVESWRAAEESSFKVVEEIQEPYTTLERQRASQPPYDWLGNIDYSYCNNQDFLNKELKIAPLEVGGAGHCQFYCIAYCAKKDISTQAMEMVRHEVAEYMKLHTPRSHQVRDPTEPSSTWSEYCDSFKDSLKWGNQTTLAAACDLYKFGVDLHTIVNRGLDNKSFMSHFLEYDYSVPRYAMINWAEEHYQIAVTPFKVRVRQSVFRGNNQKGDFMWEIHEREEVYERTLYIFNDNEQDHKTSYSGGGSAVIRPFNKFNYGYARSAGICTGPIPARKIPDLGYQELTEDVKKVIDRDINEIKELLHSGKYNTVAYSKDPDRDLIGTGKFIVNPDVLLYITTQLHQLDHYIGWYPFNAKAGNVQHS